MHGDERSWQAWTRENGRSSRQKGLSFHYVAGLIWEAKIESVFPHEEGRAKVLAVITNAPTKGAHLQDTPRKRLLLF
jgi:hypothetical protein